MTQSAEACNTFHKARVSCQKGPICHAKAWRVGPFWKDAIENMLTNLFWLSSLCYDNKYLYIYIWLTYPYTSGLFHWNCGNDMITQIAKFMGPTWAPPGSCRPQMGPILAPWNLLLPHFSLLCLMEISCMCLVRWHMEQNILVYFKQ